MAGTIVNTLYPPQIDSIAPAFSYLQDAKFYYAFSPYNTALDVNYVHIALVSQDTNENVLNTGAANTGIIIQRINHDDNGYYIILKPTDIIKERHNNNSIIVGWNVNKIYKLQIRFDKTTSAGSGIVPNSTAEYLNTNQENFSEWSTVCLLQPIVAPVLNMQNLSDSSSSRTSINQGILLINGDLTSEDNLHYFIISVRNSNNAILYSSEKVYTSNNIKVNHLYYRLNLMNLNLSAGNYTIRIEYTTKHLYSDFKDYYITIVENQQLQYFNPTLTVESDNENGLMILNVKNDIQYSGKCCNLYVKRTSSSSNFTVWEDLKIIKNIGTNGKFNISITDNTIESMVWYKYSVQAGYANSVNEAENLFTPVYITQVVINDFYDIILSRADKQIRLAYNINITSYKQNINRAKFDTLGGKYPKFAENGKMNYMSLQFGGLISSQEDEQALFLSKSDVFNTEVKNLYNNYNSNQQITEYNDYLWERIFRKELLNWLNDGEPKLLRSETEGNLIVMLTDISLTPFQGTSRRLYNFSATAYEVADADSLDNMHKLGIISIE